MYANTMSHFLIGTSKSHDYDPLLKSAELAELEMSFVPKDSSAEAALLLVSIKICQMGIHVTVKSFFVTKEMSENTRSTFFVLTAKNTLKSQRFINTKGVFTISRIKHGN